VSLTELVELRNPAAYTRGDQKQNSDYQTYELNACTNNSEMNGKCIHLNKCTLINGWMRDGGRGWLWAGTRNKPRCAIDAGNQSDVDFVFDDDISDMFKCTTMSLACNNFADIPILTTLNVNVMIMTMLMTTLINRIIL
jgi:hypothetical protein